MADTKSIGIAYRDQAIEGGTLDNTPIGGTTPAAGAFTTLSATGNVSLGDAAGDTIAFNGAAGSAQATFIATQSINALSVSGVVGFTSSTSLSSLVTKVNEITAILSSLGLMASS